ncbi:MAG: dienelactone hydrolase family protein [Saprospiraceae bacterium]|nr:dienelactone hydrolase family protein [Saprospiraceae bacterium]
MEIKENKINVQRTGVFYTSGDLKEAPIVWFVCHGYGQLGNTIIRKFDFLVDQGHSVLSAESMNRFYWQGVSGQVATTWMTKRYRLDEINDNNAYLTSLYESSKNQSKRILLGFSQGGTTIWRWIFDHRPDFDVFINYAGWMPEDIDLSLLQDYLKDKTLVFTYGANDEYLTEDRMKMFHEVISNSKLKIHIHKTEGTHKIDREVLKDIVDKYVKTTVD